ncbi:uncharacterized protein BDR25DRAFT_42878 [Lindgomyces ingoldianus]|uniref:Uncharacterized protein n=1 Tax=Lindgomyces ingoldianus TaxID=673940 RepID=A0ACB6RD24_9PLEO|nr:uncharacterized protein BDR25DRAFT_42878 [Lindgomyces ingoldianus]KAF2477002.1 hypothetical protein BDR25DRAFT_42878 [Lindgomyces ingoldianus]
MSGRDPLRAPPERRERPSSGCTIRETDDEWAQCVLLLLRRSRRLERRRRVIGCAAILRRAWTTLQSQRQPRLSLQHRAPCGLAAKSKVVQKAKRAGMASPQKGDGQTVEPFDIGAQHQKKRIPHHAHHVHQPAVCESCCSYAVHTRRCGNRARMI